MIARLRGSIVEKSDTDIIIDCQGVGYTASISLATAEALNDEGDVTIFTYLAVREDALQLFGFATREERDVFLQLISISGIGGRTALALLSATTLHELRDAILTKNATFLQKLPGIGKKTAERIVLELRDKIDKVELATPGTLVVSMGLVQQEAVAGMASLGYNKAVAEKAVKAAMTENPTLNWTAESLLRAALKSAGK